MLFAERAGLRYAHTPFRRMGDFPPAFVERWERFLNLGEDEIPVGDAAPLLDRVQVGTLLDLPFGRSNTLYVVRHCHEYANAFPEQYGRIIDRFARKYHASPKGGLPSYYDRSRLNVAVHVRRGDVAPQGKHASRYTSNGYVASVLRDVLSAGDTVGLPLSVQLYSEGDVAEFGELRNMEVAFHLSECPFATFNNLVDADVLLMSKSTFSYVAALLSRGVAIYESFRGTPLDHKPLRRWLVAGANGRLSQWRLRRALAGVGRRL
jgi:hypothetical protein